MKRGGSSLASPKKLKTDEEYSHSFFGRGWAVLGAQPLIGY